MAQNAPYIKEMLPAQFGDTLCIPFEHNGTITSDIIKCKIKSIYENEEYNMITILSANNIAEFSLSENNISLSLNQKYTIQLAYEDSELYSNTRVFTYIETEPIVKLNCLSSKITATYEHDSEKISSYRFDIYDNDKIVETSNKIIAKQNTNISIVYILKKIRNNVKCKFSYQTVNNYSNFVEQNIEIYFDTASLFNIEVSKDKGYNIVSLKEEYLQGQTFNTEEEESNIQIVKSEVGSDDWIVVANDSTAVTDSLIESGTAYQYGVYSNGVITVDDTSVSNEFEDMFLEGNGKKLKIRFNPKVSSFKRVVLESKIDTLGSQYPIFFRNGNVDYKEFSISGLISYLSESEGFITNETENEGDSFLTDLTPENIKKEKEFRLAVLDWLTDGNPKTFQSETEGTYIVRLMNVSLTPTDSLGRMLYTFQATAYECSSTSKNA